MSRVNWVTIPCAAFLLWAAAAVPLPAQTFTTVYSFVYIGSGGINPSAGLVQGGDGNFYGATFYGGDYNVPSCSNGCGTVFEITPSGTLTTLHTFDGTDGGNLYAGMVLGTDGNFYGTTESGGTLSDGNVFKITPSGTLTTLHSFNGYDGLIPDAALIQGTDGNFYGTAEMGGAFNGGTVLKITPSGELTTLYSFCSMANCPDGVLPVGGLIQGTDGNFYGTTYQGGVISSCSGIGCGTVFKITPSGTLTTLHSFLGNDGAHPYAGLLQATNGNFYGTTFYGGTGPCGNRSGCGTVFEITPTGILTTLHKFDETDGAGPLSLPRLTEGTDGNFYGTTFAGGPDSSCELYGFTGCGTVFKISPSGTLTTLYIFDNNVGAFPYSGLIQSTNGELYGTTDGGGSDGEGIVFSLDVGLGPFVETNPTSGPVGTAVNILGSNFVGATSVTFNGTPATFTRISKTRIKTTVPAGATTGTVEVSGPNHNLSSNVPFRVLP